MIATHRLTADSTVFIGHGFMLTILFFRSERSNKIQEYMEPTLVVKAAPSNQNTKPNSMVCADCDGNGAVLCSQCKGSGVNSADIFNGRFKAGDSCWLCGGRKEMLCGNCNGAGFIGGFMSTFDE
ncbi:PLASTID TRANSCRIPTIONALLY ACTIVE PROTEIN [Salix viminalis]|uniref:PLASTID TRANSCRIPTIONALLY ACTIVE PROTEIN n=1 Tax=Salix viminalis TaxID=40686 RepID=A0A9Q0NQH6_SALVM|nr:PLASTID TRANSCRIPTIONALLY ACTIVE PROTEIN [Salix viminalis]